MSIVDYATTKNINYNLSQQKCQEPIIRGQESSNSYISNRNNNHNNQWSSMYTHTPTRSVCMNDNNSSNKTMRRKKFLSVTQSKQSHQRQYHSEKKSLNTNCTSNIHQNHNNIGNNFNVNNNNKINANNLNNINPFTNKKQQHTALQSRPRQLSHQQHLIQTKKQYEPNNPQLSFNSIKQLLTPTNTLKYYISSVLNSISKHSSLNLKNQSESEDQFDQQQKLNQQQHKNQKFLQIQKYQNNHQKKLQEEKILNQNDCIMMTNNKKPKGLLSYSPQIGKSQKQLQIKLINTQNHNINLRPKPKSKTKIITEDKFKHQRIYTEHNEHQPFTIQKHKKHQVQSQHILLTQPNRPITSDSRNFFVFEEKLGENTLTRKDSLILALMENISDYGNDNILENSFRVSARQDQRNIINHSSPNQNQQQKQENPQQYLMNKLRKSISLIQSHSNSQIPQSIIDQKLKQKTQSQQQKVVQKDIKSFGQTTIKQHRPQQQKIKFISLVQKQQCLRYKNCVNQNLGKDKFINLHKNSHKSNPTS